MLSENIAEIEEFLKTSHPDDPRNKPLKKKIIQLKNLEWTKGAAAHKPMEARYNSDSVKAETEKQQALIQKEKEEFDALMKEYSKKDTEKTLKLLNTLFDRDINKKETVVVIRNNSDCDFTLNLVGETTYKVSIITKSKNIFTIDKGFYELSCNICGVNYKNKRNVYEYQEIIIGNRTALK